MMERKFKLNFKELSSFIDKQQTNPERTDGELAIFTNNIKNLIANILNTPKEIIIIIDESSGEVSINNEKNLQTQFKVIPTGYKIDNKSSIYRQIKLAMEESRKYGIYDKIFEEITEQS